MGVALAFDADVDLARVNANHENALADAGQRRLQLRGFFCQFGVQRAKIGIAGCGLSGLGARDAAGGTFHSG